MTTMIYIAIGPNCWGKGKTIEEAWKNCKKEWPKFLSAPKPDKSLAVFFHTPDTIYVNDLGGLSGPFDDHEKIVKVDSEGNPL